MTRNIFGVARSHIGVVAIVLAFLAPGLADAIVLGERPQPASLSGDLQGQDVYGATGVDPPGTSDMEAESVTGASPRSSHRAANYAANPAPRPSARNGHDMAYDAESDRTILFGGFDGTAALAETWGYDFNDDTWGDMEPLVSPPARRLHAMVYDPPSDLVVLFGGFDEANDLGDTWVYDFNTNTWTEKNPASAPSPRRAHKMAYDAESDRVILHGGIGDPSATWSYDVDNNTWTEVTPAVGPSAFDHGLAYDSQSDRIVLFGGLGSDETWMFDLNSNMWTKVDPQTRPPALSHFAMAYDPQSDRVILFGGVQSGVTRDETWVFDLNSNAWTNANPPLGPSRRLGHQMAYDAESDRVVLFGGISTFGGIRNDETWAYDFDTNSWTQLSPPSDTTRPTISITSPTEGATLETATVEVTGTASDNVGVERVELSLDGVSWDPATGTDNWSGTLSLLEGPNTIHARATDASGNAANASVMVTVEPSEPLPPDLTPILIGIGAAAAIVVGVVLIWRRRAH